MIERIDDVPETVLGLRASGEVSADDYREVLEPALRSAAESGEIRLLYVLDPSFAMDAGAMMQDAKVGIDLGFAHRAAWKRTAVVTDAEWVAKAIRAFAWMAPGEVRVFGLAELDAGRDWVAA